MLGFSQKEKDAKELAELETRCLGLDGKPLPDADTEDLVRMAELQEKRDNPAEEIHDVVPLESLTVAELKEVAESDGIKGYANMSKAKLLEAIGAKMDAPTEPEKPTVPEKTETDRLIAEGYKYLGTNGKVHCYTGPDGKAYMSHGAGLRSVGNKFGDKLLKSLKK